MFRFRFVANRCKGRNITTLLDSANIEQKAAALLAKIVEPVTGRPLGSVGSVQVSGDNT